MPKDHVLRLVRVIQLVNRFFYPNQVFLKGYELVDGSTALYDLTLVYKEHTHVIRFNIGLSAAELCLKIKAVDAAIEQEF